MSHLQTPPQEGQPPTSSPLKEGRARPLTLSCPDSEDDRIRSASGQVIQFQEFVPEEDNQQEQRVPLISKEKNTKKFVIDIPETEYQREISSQQISQQQKKCWQPPVPTHKKHNKAPQSFVFPPQPPQKPYQSHNNILPSSSPKVNQRYRDLSVEELIASFDKERQQFYRQKSRFEKQLLVKEGQIDILQTTLSNLVGSQQQKGSLLKQNKDFQYLQEMVRWKDEQINNLILKVEELDEKIIQQGYALSEAKDQCNRLKLANATLQNQLFVASAVKWQEQANNSYKLYQDRSSTNYNSVKPKQYQPTQHYSRSYEGDKTRQQHLKMLQKRLDTLSEHRKQLQERERSNSYKLNLTMPIEQRKCFK